MRSALELLDSANEDAAAVHLQHAISIVEQEPMDGWAEDESPDDEAMQGDERLRYR